MSDLMGRLPNSAGSGSLGDRLQALSFKTEMGKIAGTESQKETAQTGKKAPTAQGRPADHISLSAGIKDQLRDIRQKQLEMRSFGEDYETKLMGFMRSDPTKEQIKQAARFAAYSIWDMLKKARIDEEDDMEISSQLLAMLMKMHSQYTFEHSERVMDWTVAFAREMGIESEEDLDTISKAAFFRDIGKIGSSIAERSDEDLEEIGDFVGDSLSALKECGSLHDIGKMRIPQEIINKTAPLTDDEYAIIKTHPIIGVEIVKPYPSLHKAIPGIRHHHEKWNGTGYPDQLSEEEIPLVARMITITDSFDAMTEDRPYRKGLSHAEAVAELFKYSGKQFDPELVPVFVRTLYRIGDIAEKDIDPERLESLRLDEIIKEGNDT